MLRVRHWLLPPCGTGRGCPAASDTLLCGAALAGSGHLLNRSSEQTDPSSRAFNLFQPEGIFPHTYHRAPLATATSLRHTGKPDPDVSSVLLKLSSCQGDLGQSGSRWLHLLTPAGKVAAQQSDSLHPFLPDLSALADWPWLKAPSHFGVKQAPRMAQ